MRFFVAALALAVAGPVVAQDRMVQEQCVQSLVGGQSMLGPEFITPDVEVNAEGWCLVQDMEIAIDSQTRVRLSSLKWRASDIDRFLEQGLPPRAFEFEGLGFHVVPETGNEVFDYLLGLQMRQSQIDFGASARWDGVQNTISLTAAYINFDDTNRIEGTARIEGVDLTDVSSIQTSLGTAGLRNLTVNSRFDGWIEGYLAFAFGFALLTSDDDAPETQVAALQRQTIGFINQIPDDLMPANNRTALADFVTSLPMPRGEAELQLDAEPAIGAARAAGFASLSTDSSVAEILETRLDGVSMLFTWMPTEDE